MKELYSAILENNNMNFLLMSDFNSRMGSTQKISKYCLTQNVKTQNLNRNSKYSIVNKKRIQMLDFLNDFNSAVLNGRTINDKRGELTFIGGNGQSVIDYSCIA